MRIQLPDDVVEAVATRTEGWLVGLQLLGLSLQGHALPLDLLEEVSGSQRYIFDYLIEEELAMEYTQLGQTSLHVSRISYGTWQFGGDWGQVERSQWDAGKATVQQALELGINFFDTAHAYGFGLAEKVLGEALQPYLKGLREEVVLATKGGLRMAGDKLVRDSSARWLRQGVEQSLRNLGVDYIDLYQVHWPDPHTPFAETASALDQLVQEGKIRYVGVSNYDVAQMKAFAYTRKLAALQPAYSLFRRTIEQEILPYSCKFYRQILHCLQSLL